MKNVKLLLITLVTVSVTGLNAITDRFEKPTGPLTDYKALGLALRPCDTDADCSLLNNEHCVADPAGKVATKYCVRQSTAFGTAGIE